MPDALPLSECPSFKSLRLKKASKTIKQLFDEDPQRGNTHSIRLDLNESEFIYFDYSKNNIDTDSWRILLQLIKERGLREKMDQFFSGKHINSTEDRAVLHMALRDLVDYFKFGFRAEVEEELEKMANIAEPIRQTTWRGQTKKPIKDIVNIGIGGSDLGPCMVTEALQFISDSSLNLHFVSNVDGGHLERVLQNCQPESTLFIIVSKTFTTRETIMNAKSAKAWLKIGNITEFDKHFVAVSSNTEAVNEFGIVHSVKFWDWVGGRYSLWSAVGLSIMIAIGCEGFTDLLEGAHLMDKHFFSSPLERNIPVLAALVGIWHRNVLEYPTYAVIPYEQALSRLPAYLQQLDMESNGKSALIDPPNGIVHYSTGPIVWGEPGTNGQHAFFQLIHQGTDVVPVDFLIGAKTICEQSWATEHHLALYANCVAQSEALMIGKASQDVHKNFPGNKPSNTIVYSQLSPRTLGAIIALYEHKIFVQGAIWGINSFDQMGVELGKQLANVIEPELHPNSSPPPANHCSSTLELIKLFKAQNY